MEVFVSWTSADRYVKDEIVERLRAEGIGCWDSDVECVSDFSRECIENIKRCQVFIVIISKASMQKGYVKNEVIKARELEGEGKLNILVYKLTDEPYTPDFELQLNHISYTGSFVQRREGSGGIDTIVERTKKLLRLRKEGNPEKPFEANTPKIDGVELVKAGFFVEHSRDSALEQLAIGFERSNVVIIKELFGFGKRSIARKCAELYRDKYDSIVLVDNCGGDLSDFFTFNLRFQNINEKRFENSSGSSLMMQKIRELSKLDERTMIVVTNVSEDNEPDDDLYDMMTGLKCRFLLLMQETPVYLSDRFPVINLGRMADEHLLELFYHYYNYADDDEKETLREPLISFFSRIGGHTKTVELTAAVLSRDFGVMPDELPKYLSMKGAEGTRLEERIMGQIESLIDLEGLTSDELTVLVAASLMAVPEIPEKDFRRILQDCGVEDWSAVVTLERHRWLDIDKRRRTVSTEPLIAGIVLKRFPDAYHIMISCIDYFGSHSSFFVNYGDNSTLLFSVLRKLEYFFTAAGLPPEYAEMTELVGRYISDGESFDEEKRLLEIIGSFDDRGVCEKKRLDEDFINGIVDNIKNAYAGDGGNGGNGGENSDGNFDFGIDDDNEIDEFDENVPEYEMDEFSEAYFKLKAEEYVRSFILPLARIAASERNRMLYMIGDISAAAGYAPEIDSFADSGRSILEIAESIRSMVCSEADGELDPDGEAGDEQEIWFEACEILEMFSKRNYAGMTDHLDRLLELAIDSAPDDDTMEIIDSIVIMLVGMVRRAGNPRAAAMLCSRALSIKSDCAWHVTVLMMYIDMLSSLGDRGDELFAAYGRLFASGMRAFEGEFKSRVEVLNAKKLWTLKFASDLALAGKPREAERKFAEGAGTGENEAHADEAVEAAKNIVDAYINGGMFEEAAEFIEKELGKGRADVYRSACGGEQSGTLDMLESIREMAANREKLAFSAGGDQEQYTSYYREFLKENNGGNTKKYERIASQASRFDFSGMTDSELAEAASSLRARSKREPPLSLMPESFALVSEAGMRALGYRHHYVQYAGAAAMADGKIAEIMNGEGKTYTIVLTAFYEYVCGRKVVVADASKYLTRRNFSWMHGVFELLGVSVGCIDDNKKIDKSYVQPDVLYADIASLIFAILQSEISLTSDRCVIRTDSIIIDEADSVLVDSASQEYTVVSAENKNGDNSAVARHQMAYRAALMAEDDADSYIDGGATLSFTPEIVKIIESVFGVSYSDVTAAGEIREAEQLVRIALTCLHNVKGKDYYIKDGKPVVEDRERGVYNDISPSWRYFLCRINELDTAEAERALSRSSTVRNKACLRDICGRFAHVCGTTATAVSFRREFEEIYGLEYVSIPPMFPCVRKDTQSPIYIDRFAKEEAILADIAERHRRHQPILIMTGSIEESERYSRLCSQKGIKHRLLNANNVDESSDILSNAGVTDSVLITTAIANRGVDIKLGGNPELMTKRELAALEVDISDIDSFIYSKMSDGMDGEKAEVFKKYRSILEKNRMFAEKERAAVIAAGGLAVIGTSFFEEMRTEQQLRGRSGRQGDVGESIVYRSVNDDALRRLISPEMIEWIERLFDDVESKVMDGKILEKSLKSARQKLHDAKFADIRKRNSELSHIEKARADFIGRKFDIRRDRLTVDDVLIMWAKDDETLAEFSRKQKNSFDVCSPLMNYIYKKYCDKFGFKFERGAKASSAAILKALRADITARYKTENYNDMPELKTAYCSALLSAWASFIEFEKKLCADGKFTERTVERSLEAEKRRLLRDAAVSLFRVRIPTARTQVKKMNDGD